MNFSDLCLPQLTSEASNELLHSMSNIEIQQNLNKLNDKAAPGLDGLSVAWYRAFLPDIIDYLREMYNYLFTSPDIPPEFGQLQGILIPKDNKHISLSKIRFISLYNVDYKLFTKILVTRLTPYIGTVTHPHQYGIPGCLPLYVVLGQLRDFIQHVSTTLSHNYAILATDLSRAFDTISLPFLYHVLHHLNFPDTFITLLTKLYNSRHVHIKVNGRQLSRFPMRVGLSQGCPLSSLMFT